MKASICVAAAMLFATTLIAGYSYQFQTVVSGPRGNRVTTGQAIVDGNNVRVEFTKGDNMLFPDAAIAISHDGGKNFTVINPAEKSYYTIPREDILDSSRGMRPREGVQMSFANAKLDVKDQGEGGTIEGFPTRKYVVDSSYDATMEAPGRSMSNHVEMKNEVWASDKLSGDLTTFPLLRGFRVGVDDLEKLAAQHPIKGFPLKQVMTATTSSTAGGSRSWTTTATVTGVQKKTAAASDFEIPAGYTKTERPQPSRPQ